jgi:hypothetical protein
MGKRRRQAQLLCSGYHSPELLERFGWASATFAFISPVENPGLLTLSRVFPRAHPDFSSGRREFGRVLQQIPKRLLESAVP